MSPMKVLRLLTLVSTAMTAIVTVNFIWNEFLRNEKGFESGTDDLTVANTLERPLTEEEITNSFPDERTTYKG